MREQIIHNYLDHTLLDHETKTIFELSTILIFMHPSELRNWSLSKDLASAVYMYNIILKTAVFVASGVWRIKLKLSSV